MQNMRFTDIKSPIKKSRKKLKLRIEQILELSANKKERWEDKERERRERKRRERKRRERKRREQREKRERREREDMMRGGCAEENIDSFFIKWMKDNIKEKLFFLD